ncbi:protein transport protein SEC16B homolog isoform X1 [Carya illinoinensis]|uniref:Protein transport protein sec16 n=1 Tax=Carya illinoinensis TaxID=32201 RepID=A0A8T1NPH4_CARIL|nr:protein transport protein SEC16B homolog isoform X1 [Carya illinoinensis]KAG6633509.1 hypothetical protein CIPAW_12G052700 [Carya illinoinensis]
MASNPPFLVEDQTDEDFFDKLVDDEFESSTTASRSKPQFADGNDSDDAKAFANLSIGEVGNAYEDVGGGSRGGDEDNMLDSGSKSEKDCVDEAAELLGAHADERNLLISSNSVEHDRIMESSNDGIGSGLTPDLTVSKSSGSGGSRVKEVGWNSFHADTEQNGSEGFGSYSDFFNELECDSSGFPGNVGDNLNSKAEIESANKKFGADGMNNLVNYAHYQESQIHGASTEQSTNVQDLKDSQYWDNLYPGWKYDPNTGQWYQVDGYESMAADTRDSATDRGSVSDGKTEVSYMQQAAHSAVGTVTETSSTECASNWSQVSQGNNVYPDHMVFDPQYPGWFYDTIAQEWRALDTYTSSVLSTAQTHDQQHQNGFVSSGSLQQNNNSLNGEYFQTDNYGQGFVSQGADQSWAGAYDNNYQKDLNAWEAFPKSAAFTTLSGKQQMDNSYGSKVSVNVKQQKSFSSFGTVSMYDGASQTYDKVNGTVEFKSLSPDGNFNQENAKLDAQTQFSNSYFDSQKNVNVSHQSFGSGHQTSYAPNVGRSSAGRPPHALVTFGFGGKLIVMKDSSSLSSSSYGSQDPVGGSISVMNLMEVVLGNTAASSLGLGASCYFHTLCQQSFPGPLAGGSVGSRELNKWIDERITSCESSNMEYKKDKVVRLLFSLLKIACQHYGKLRSSFGADVVLKENDSPELAVAKLFASAKKNGAQFKEDGALSHYLQKLPSEGQLMATASEVQNFLVSGRKREALQCALEGQLWGPALVLASQLGDQFYVDAVKQMAVRQLVAGSPLRTLCLLIAGQPAEVFSSDTTDSGLLGGFSLHQQPTKIGANFMLDDWEENLAVITVNRTKDDELVLIHLGDCLLKERSEITAAHICYLVAEANFESYSDSARLCLIGADHWKFPRTYASPGAIQRTELYEYSKVLGNSQYVLLSFQPYKIIYAHMLAEVGKVSDSLKYCQAVLKSLKIGRAPEVETWKQLVLSLEERIRTHQQGGYATNLAPAKLVGKLLNFFDSTAHRVVGGLPPPAPSTSQGSVPVNEHYPQPTGPRVSSSQSTMAMSSLVPSASMEPISDWTAGGNRMTMANRSVSEPDFGRTPRQEQVDSSKGMALANKQGKASRFAGFGFGSQLLQKTVGLVIRPRSDRQAKLGDKNKFYYDEKLKRWVEEGAELPAEEAALPPPPPTMAAFQNGTTDYNSNSTLQTEGTLMNQSPDYKNPTPSEHSSGIPSIPSGSNHFSARGRMGVRSRYVDTFNQGGGNPASMFQSPSVPSVKPAVAANAKFFIPTPASSGEQTMEAIAEKGQEGTPTNEDPSTSIANDSFLSPVPSSSMTMQRFPSMGNVPGRVATNGKASVSPYSRRTASWGGSFSDPFSPPNPAELKPLGEVLGMPPSTSMPNEPSLMRMPMNDGSFGDDLHEVEL